jgi:hypothetical protein
MRNDMDTVSQLEDLLRQAQRLRPSWEKPELFHIAKSDLVRGLRDLIASGEAAAASPVRTTAPMPVPLALTSRIKPVVPTPSATALTITLSEAQLVRLLDLATRPNRNRRQGFQSRFARWGATVDMEKSTVQITAADTLWIRKMITARRRGGYQAHVFRVFANTHALFTDLPERPWPRRDRSQGLWRRTPRPT